MKFIIILVLIWSIFSLVSAREECFLFMLMNSNLFFLHCYALFYGFPASILLDFTIFFIFRRWHIFPFFLVLSHYHITDYSNIILLASKESTNKSIKFFKGSVYGFNGFDNPFSKNLIEIFYICF